MNVSLFFFNLYIFFGLQNKSMRAINSQLQSELETMRKEYETLKGGLRSITCTKCGGPATQGSTAVDGETEVAALRTKLAQATSENGQLREEVNSCTVVMLELWLTR